MMSKETSLFCDSFPLVTITLTRLIRHVYNICLLDNPLSFQHHMSYANSPQHDSNKSCFISHLILVWKQWCRLKLNCGGDRFNRYLLGLCQKCILKIAASCTAYHHSGPVLNDFSKLQLVLSTMCPLIFLS